MSFSQTVRIIKVHKDNKEKQSLRKVSKEQVNSDDNKVVSKNTTIYTKK